MAEALAIFGGVAGAAQLLDVAIKASDELYKFMRTVHRAEHDVQTQLSLLKDVQDTLSLVSSWIVQQHSSDWNPVDGLGQLSSSVELLLKELQELQDTMPPRQDISVRGRFKWALRQKEISAKIRNVENRQSHIKMLLEVLSLKGQTSIQGKTRHIAKTTEGLQSSLVETQLATLAIQRKVFTTEEDIRRYHDTQMHVLRDIGEALPRHTTTVERELSAQSNMLKHISGMMGLLPTTPPSLRPKSEWRTEHIVARVVREEMRIALGSIRKDLATSRLSNITFETHLHQVADDLSAQLLKEAEAEPSLTEIQTADHDRTEMLNSCKGKPVARMDAPYNDAQGSRTISEKPWTWFSISLLGNIRIRIIPCRQWDPIRSVWTQHVTVSVRFWPMVPLLPQRCFALLYTTLPQRSSYYQMFPLMATYPVIPIDAPVLKYISLKDIDGLRQELVRGRAGPNDQTSDGLTLLHYAVITMNIDIIKLLLKLGADPSQTTTSGVTPMRLLIESALHSLNRVNLWQSTLENAFEIFNVLFTGEEAMDTGAFFGVYVLDEANVPMSSTSIRATQEWASMLGRQYPDLLTSLRIGYSLVASQSKYNADFFLGLGMSPDDTVCGHPVDPPWCAPPIFLILYGFYWYKMRRMRKSFHSENMNRILQSGADIYIVCSDKTLFRDLNVKEMTPTFYAIARGIENFWKRALRQSGYNPLEVYAQDQSRRRKREIYNDAETTGSDYDTGMRPKQPLRLRRSRHIGLER